MRHRRLRILVFICNMLWVLNISCMAQQSACTFAVTPSFATISAYNLPTSLKITPSAPSCSWSIYAGDPYLIPSESSGTGTQTITYSWQGNQSVFSTTSVEQTFLAIGFGFQPYGQFSGFSGNATIVPVTLAGPQSPAFRVTTPILPPAIVGQTYSPFQLQAAGGAPPYVWGYGTSGCPTGDADSLNICGTGLVTGNGTFSLYPLEGSETFPYILPFNGFPVSDSAGHAVTIDLPFLALFSEPQASVPAIPTMLDPTPLALTDTTQSLMNGNHVTPDLPKLDTLGRAVQGIAADGTAEIVLRISTNSEGDMVTATVLSDACANSADPSTCAISTSAAFDGGLVALSNAANPEQAAPTAPVTAADSNKFAYVIYRAPVDFVRLGNLVDQLLDTRTIQFMLTYKNAQGASYGTQYLPLTIVRPPIVLTHGYASSAVETWNSFSLPVAHTSIYKVDYSALVRVARTTPGILCEFDCVTVIRQSDLGMTYNTLGVAEQSVSKLRDYALGNNVANAPVAVSQLDSIAHSMGGLIARYRSTDNAKDPLSGKSLPFRTPDNFGAGYIHKLVTLGTPNYGSPFATESLVPGGGSSSPPGSACFREVSAVEIQTIGKPARYIVGSAILADVNGTEVGGAVGELDGDGVGIRLSGPLQMIKDLAAPLPTFNIAGNTSPGLLGLVYSAVNALCGDVPSGTSIEGDPVASRMTFSLYGTLFDPNLTPATEQTVGNSTINDGVVPVTSALLGRSCNVTGTQCFDAAHGEGTQQLLGTSQNLPDDKDVQSLVNNLLNTSVQDTTKWVVQ